MEQKLDSILADTSITVKERFYSFLEEEKEKTLRSLCEKERLKPEEFKQLISRYLYNSKKPLRDDFVKTCIDEPKILERGKKIDAISKAFDKYIDVYYK